MNPKELEFIDFKDFVTKSMNELDKLSKVPIEDVLHDINYNDSFLYSVILASAKNE